MWKWLQKARSKDLYLVRIENGVSSGFADVFGYHKTEGAFFIELKQCITPKKRTSKLLFKIRQSQIIWHEKMRSLDANSWFLINIGRERYLFPSKFCESCRHLTLENSYLIKVSHLTPSKLIDFILKY